MEIVIAIVLFLVCCNHLIAYVCEVYNKFQVVGILMGIQFFLCFVGLILVGIWAGVKL